MVHIGYTGKPSKAVMERVVRKFTSFAEEEEADYAYYRKLSGNQRLQLLLELVMPENPDAGTIERSVRIGPLRSLKGSGSGVAKGRRPES